MVAGKKYEFKLIQELENLECEPDDNISSRRQYCTSHSKRKNRYISKGWSTYGTEDTSQNHSTGQAAAYILFFLMDKENRAGRTSLCQSVRMRKLDNTIYLIMT